MAEGRRARRTWGPEPGSLTTAHGSRRLAASCAVVVALRRQLPEPELAWRARAATHPIRTWWRWWRSAGTSLGLCRPWSPVQFRRGWAQTEPSTALLPSKRRAPAEPCRPRSISRTEAAHQLHPECATSRSASQPQQRAALAGCGARTSGARSCGQHTWSMGRSVQQQRQGPEQDSSAGTEMMCVGRAELETACSAPLLGAGSRGSVAQAPCSGARSGSRLLLELLTDRRPCA